VIPNLKSEKGGELMQPISVTRKLLLGLTAIALCVGLTANSARADVVGTLIPPNQEAALVGEAASNLANEILLGTDLINVALGNPLISANLANAVYRNSAGTLDFLYQLTNNANSVPISSIAVNNFSGVVTRAGYLTGALPANATGVFVAPTGGALPPTIVQRGPAGSALLFDGFTVPAGSTTNVFFVSTNFTNFNQLGQALAAATTQANGGAVFTQKFQPTAAIPEPSTFAMVGLMSMAGLGFAWKRRRATV